MTVEKNISGKSAVLTLSGRLDTQTSAVLEKELADVLPGCTDLTLDLARLEYTSSAGLRILLKAQKTMNTQGTMTLRHVNQAIMEIFEITGFDSILTIR